MSKEYLDRDIKPLRAQYRQQPLGVRYSLWRDGQWQTVTREEYQQSMDSFAQLFGAES